MTRSWAWLVAGLALTVVSPVLGALQVDLDDPASIKSAAALVAQDLLSYYSGDQPGHVPGILPGPPPDGDYYWWLGGAMWGTLLDYRAMTGDKAHDDTIMQGLTFQVGDNKDYNPKNWSASMGNDDQAFWGFAALLAAETGFTNPPSSTDVDWLALAQAVYNEQTSMDRRVNDTGVGSNCNDGLRWQVYRTNNGFDYINTIVNACYMNIAARLARYTRDDQYVAAVNSSWDLLIRLEYIDADGNIYDGAHEEDNCTSINHAQFSYNAATLIQAAATMYNYTNGAQVWEDRINHILPRTLEFFFPKGIAYEVPCETGNTCTSDMLSYKGYLHRWLAQTASLAPFTAATIMPVLKTSAAAAVAQCTGGSNGRSCGFKWSSGVFDGVTGACQEMSVLGALLSLLPAPTLLTNTTGGTSKGDPTAGSNSSESMTVFQPITTGDKAGAAILTMTILAVAIGTFVWMSY